MSGNINSIRQEAAMEEEQEVMFLEEIENNQELIEEGRNILLLGKMGTVCYRAHLLDAFPTYTFTFVDNNSVNEILARAQILCQTTNYDLIVYANMHNDVLKNIEGNYVYKLLEEMPQVCMPVSDLVQILSAHYTQDQIVILWPLAVNLALFNRAPNRTATDIEILNVRSVAGDVMLIEMMRRMLLDAPATYVPVDSMSKFGRRSRADRQEDKNCSERLFAMFQQLLNFPEPA